MPAQLLKGKPFADKIKEEVKEVEELKAKGFPKPGMVQVGRISDLKVYTNAQKKKWGWWHQV